MADGQDDGAWFDRWARGYDGDRRLLISPLDAFYGAAAEAAALHADGAARTAGADGGPVRVLDLGAGTGLLSAALAGALPGCALTLLDEAPGMLAEARRRFDVPGAPEVRIIEGDLLAQMPDGPFDVVASCLAIHHLPHEEQAEVYRAARERLAPGGVFVQAEQLHAPAAGGAGLEEHYVEREVRRGRAAGLTTEAEEQARIRWTVDRHVELETHLGWMHAAGYDVVDVPFKAWRFAVLAGWRRGF